MTTRRNYHNTRPGSRGKKPLVELLADDVQDYFLREGSWSCRRPRQSCGGAPTSALLEATLMEGPGHLATHSAPLVSKSKAPSPVASPSTGNSSISDGWGQIRGLNIVECEDYDYYYDNDDDDGHDQNDQSASPSHHTRRQERRDSSVFSSFQSAGSSSLRSGHSRSSTALAALAADAEFLKRYSLGSAVGSMNSLVYNGRLLSRSHSMSDSTTLRCSLSCTSTLDGSRYEQNHDEDEGHGDPGRNRGSNCPRQAGDGNSINVARLYSANRTSPTFSSRPRSTMHVEADSRHQWPRSSAEEEIGWGYEDDSSSSDSSIWSGHSTDSFGSSFSSSSSTSSEEEMMPWACKDHGRHRQWTHPADTQRAPSPDQQWTPPADLDWNRRAPDPDRHWTPPADLDWNRRALDPAPVNSVRCKADEHPVICEQTRLLHESGSRCPDYSATNKPNQHRRPRRTRGRGQGRRDKRKLERRGSGLCCFRWLCPCKRPHK